MPHLPHPVGPLELAAPRAARAARATRRLVRWQLAPASWPTPVHGGDDWPIVADVAVPIGRTDPHADPQLEAGKRVNVALAAPAFDGLVLAPDRPLSFWRALGRI